MTRSNTDAVTEHHPLYSEHAQDMLFMRTSYRGQRQIKEAKTVHLPATSGQIADGARSDSPGEEPAVGVHMSDGQNSYNAYLKRAVYHNFVKRAVKAALGIMHHKPATIDLPPELEYMRETATTKGEGLQLLLRKINESQLVEGRIGLLVDVVVPKKGKDGKPIKDSKDKVHIAAYTGVSIINWDDGEQEELVLGNLNLVVLDETGFERQDRFQWEVRNKYRVLVLGDLEPNEGQTSGVKYRAGEFTEEGTNKFDFDESKLVEPKIKGKKTPKEIPFTFINSMDLVPEPEESPLLDLANLAITVYRGEADYRQNLFMQGQDTLVIIGGTSRKKGGEQERVGAGAKINIPMKGDAKYIGVDSKGLPEQRLALDNDKKEASQLGGQLLDTATRTKESEGSLGIRVSGQTATLNEIVLTGAAGLENALKQSARWLGADDKLVKVTPNMDFADDDMDSESLKEFMEAYILGAPISLKTIHGIMFKKELTTMTFEEEMDAKDDDIIIPKAPEPVAPAITVK